MHGISPIRLRSGQAPAAAPAHSCKTAQIATHVSNPLNPLDPLNCQKKQDLQAAD
jgi:hypothetical protein